MASQAPQKSVVVSDAPRRAEAGRLRALGWQVHPRKFLKYITYGAE